MQIALLLIKLSVMARQKGLNPLEGTIGGITYYKSKAGYLAREKGGVSADRIASDPKFERTRENGAEFGRAGKAGQLLRMVFRELLMNASDSYMSARLTTRFVKVIQADRTSARGQRNVIDGECELLQGFDFNIEGKLATTFYAAFTANIDRVAGTVGVDLPAFIPSRKIAAPVGATHFRVNCIGAEVDFEAGTFVNDLVSTPELPINKRPTDAANLSINLPANSAKPLFVALGIEFFQQTNGELYELKTGNFNALSIVRVSGVPDAVPGP